MGEEIVLGIDLGTTNSVCAVFEGGKSVRVIPNQEGERITPSVVAFAGNEVLVGTPARRQAASNPERTIHSVKRLIGRSFQEVASEAGRTPYEIVAGPRHLARVRVGGNLLSPEEVSAHILRKLKKSAESVLGCAVRSAVITVPANFHDKQRQATRDAGRLAGLEVRRIINEPTAAVLAHGLDRMEDALVLAYDFGGGTFDVSILEIKKSIVRVIATAGQAYLGGDDLDRRVMGWLSEEYEREFGASPAGDPGTRVRLREVAEQAKIALSSAQETRVQVPFLPSAQGQPHSLERVLTRARLESMIRDLVEATVTCCRRALADARLRSHDVADVLLVGGSSRIPLVRQAVADFLGREPRSAISPEEIVAVGAAVQGGILSGAIRHVHFSDVLPLSLGIETSNGSFTRVVPRNTPIPVAVTRTFSTARDSQESVGIHILQGEREEARRNTSLGRFVLGDLPPLPRGVPRVEVAFQVDADGILHVAAREQNTGRGRRVMVRTRTGLGEDEIRKILAEAEKHGERDARAQALAEKRNLLDGLVLELEKVLAQPDVSEERAGQLKPLLEQGRAALAATDVETLTAAAEDILRTLRMRRDDASLPAGDEVRTT
jgi:molecular chaperone DnaK